MPQPTRLPVSLLLRCLAGAGGIAAAMLLYAAASAQSRTVPPSAKKPPAAPKRVHEAAAAFLAALRSEQRVRTVLAFDGDERFNWHFVPRARQGLAFGDMTDAQQAAALALLRSSLSGTGYRKVTTIRELETILREMENDTRGVFRNRDHFYFTVFGTPSATGVWGWRYEGHHVSLNWTMIRGEVIASSPQFLGANPARVAAGSGPLAGTRALAAEEDLARALVTSLDEKQRARAIIDATAPADILTGAQRQAAIQEDKGIPYKALKGTQQGMLLALIEEHANAQPPAVARKRLAAIRKNGLDGVKFAWMGGLLPGQGHYYRVQGATFLIEYDNTQNQANHVHTVWRDFKGDFGADLLADHYRTSPHHQHAPK
jgi:hypothetical protein